jgi:multidrug efflux pump subunit AcrA (membrane-fusion protein)
MMSQEATSGLDEFRFEEFRVEESPPSGRHWRRWLAVLAVAIAVIAGALWVVNPFASSAASLVTATATTGTIISSVNLSGSVASTSVKELNFGASGTVTAVNVAVGDTVTNGQVLATIDDTALQVQLESAQANLDAAQARLELDKSGPTAATIASARDSVSQAKLQLKTARQSLSDTNAQNAQSIASATAAVTAANATLAADAAILPAGDPQLAKDQAAVDSATSALSAASLKASVSVHQGQAQVDSASLGVTAAQHNYALKIAPATASQIASDQASVASAQQALTTLQQSATVITSPIQGTVTAVNVAVGQQVAAASGASSSSSSSSTSGQIQVMDLTRLQVAGQASETDIANLKMGQAATVSATVLGSDTLVGKVCARSIVGAQISGVTSYGVTVCLDGSNPKLLIGMSVTAAVVTDRADGAVLVPSLAVKTVGGQQVVSVLGSDGKTQTNVTVQVGLTNGSQTQIVSGIADGTIVVESVQTTTTTGGGNFRQFPGGGFVGP